MFELQKLDGEPLPADFRRRRLRNRSTIEEKVKVASAGKAYVEPAKNSVDQVSGPPPAVPALRHDLHAAAGAVARAGSRHQVPRNADDLDRSGRDHDLQLQYQGGPGVDRRSRTPDHHAQETDRRARDPTSPIWRRPRADEGDDSGSFAADETEFNIFNTDRKLSALEDAATQAGRVPREESADLFLERRRQDRRRKSIADQGHRQRRRSRQRLDLSGGRARPGRHCLPAATHRRLRRAAPA